MAQHARRLLHAAILAVAVLLLTAGTHHAHAADEDTTNYVEKATRELLLTFPSAMGPLDWAGESFCSWSGITCVNASGSSTVSINLSNKALTGSLPSISSVGNVTTALVSSIDISANPKLVGEFPSSWSALSKLTSLNLSHTSVRGAIPDAWSSMTALTTVAIANTRACRQLPSWGISTLVTADLSANEMGGTLASSWSTMTALTTVNITGNPFCGCVPESWAPSTVLTAAVTAANGNFGAANCATANVCTDASSVCATDASTAPAQLVVAVGAALVALAAVTGL